jgi:hypothetical protein
MAYNDDLQWSDLTGIAEHFAALLKDGLIGGAEGKKEWDSFRDSRTDAQIATALGVTETAVADLNYMYTKMLDLYQFSNSADPTGFSAEDRIGILRKFT